MVESPLVLFSREFDDLHDDGFEGSVDEQRIFTEVFFGSDMNNKPKGFNLSDTVTIDCCNYIKQSNMSLSSKTGISSLTSQGNFEKEDFSGNCPLLSIKTEHDMKLPLGDKLNVKSNLGNVQIASSPSEGILSGMSQENSGTARRSFTYRLVESSGQGVTSGVFELRPMPSVFMDKGCGISGTGSSKNGISSLDNCDQKIAPNGAVTSPVSQESCASKRQVADPVASVANKTGTYRSTKPKWKDSCFVKLDDEELAMPKDIKNDPRPLLRYHIHRLFIGAGWVIGRRKRNHKYNGIGEYVYKSPEGRPIREFHRAWCMCGESLSADVISSMQTAVDCMQWTNMAELWNDLSRAIEEIDDKLSILENTASMARLWCILDPFANVVFIEKSIRSLKEGNTVKAKRSLPILSNSVSAAKYQKVFQPGKSNLKLSPLLDWGFDDDANQVLFDVPITSGSPQMLGEGPETLFLLQDSNTTLSHIDQLENNEGGRSIKKSHKKSRKLSEMGLIRNDVDEYHFTVGEISSSSCGSKKSKLCRLNDDDLLVSAIIKTKRGKPTGKWSNRKSKSVRKRKTSKGSCKLLPRSLKKGGKQIMEGNWYSIGSRTVLSWLLHSGAISLNEVIQYRNLEDDSVIKDGLITRDGILCKCCNLVFSISAFTSHAGFCLNHPCMNLFMESGKPFTLCQLEGWTAEFKARKITPKTDEGNEIDQNDDSCGRCGDVGELICCDNCPSAFHKDCLFEQELPEGNWYCPQCRCQICGDGVNYKEASQSSGSLKCCQCEDKYHEACIQQKGMKVELASDSWFCGDGCQKVYTGLQSRVGLKNHLSDGFSWTLLRSIADDRKVHSAPLAVALSAECNSKLSVAITIMEQCFLPMVDTKTGIDMIPQVIFNWGSQFARLNYTGFFTVILEKDDIALCVASIRVHGVKVAELPLIATCRKYRRQGMCRRLINSIEEMMKSLNVEMLVISAIPTLVETWTVGFGFQPLEEAERQNLSKINLMVFPGSVWLKKPLCDRPTISASCNNVPPDSVKAYEMCRDVEIEQLSDDYISAAEEYNDAQI